MTEPSGALKGALSLVVAAVIAASAPAPGNAQVAADAWLPFLGCWQAEEAGTDAPLTCVRPLPDGGVEMLAVTGEGVIESRVIRADGMPRPSTVADCPGVEQAHLSGDARRIYLEAERTCPGEPARVTRGLIAMVDRDRWVEVQAMEVRGQSVAWVTAYVPASRTRVQAAGQADLLAQVDRRGPAVQAARMAAGAPITVDDVIEAYAMTDPEAVRAWVAQQAHRIPLDADGLRRLAEAGVPDHIIDVVVAVAYPERFALADAAPAEAYPQYRRPVRPVYPLYPHYPGYWGYWDPYYSYYRGGIGWGWGWGGYYYSPRVIVVTPRDGTRSPARAIQGRGYTRGTSSSATTGSTVRTPTRSATPRAAPSPAPSSSRTGSDRAVAPSRPSSPPAATRGGSSGTSRTATPRRTANPRND
jgi:hypothetical protein